MEGEGAKQWVEGRTTMAGAGCTYLVLINARSASASSGKEEVLLARARQSGMA